MPCYQIEDRKDWSSWSYSELLPSCLLHHVRPEFSCAGSTVFPAIVAKNLRGVTFSLSCNHKDFNILSEWLRLTKGRTRFRCVNSVCKRCTEMPWRNAFNHWLHFYLFGVFPHTQETYQNGNCRCCSKDNMALFSKMTILINNPLKWELAP